MAATTSLESVAHVVQVALTPVFLLSGIAALMNVFATRLARVADRVDLLKTSPAARDEEDYDLQLARLRFRNNALDWAVVLAALGGLLTCGATLVLFVGSLRDAILGDLLFALFGGAVVSTMGALFAFMLEMLVAGRAVRHAVQPRRP